MSIVLEFHLPGGCSLNGQGLLPEDLHLMQVNQLERLEISNGRDIVPLGDLCKIYEGGNDQDDLIITGDTHKINRIGFGMKSGRLIVIGNAGQLPGAGMTGGIMEVHGNVGDMAGASMSGGILNIFGSSGDLVGTQLLGRKYGLNGGEIYITDNAGSDTGSRMRGGLIVVGGNTHLRTGYRMRAGTIMVYGKMGQHAGLGMQRGSIVADLCESLPPGFNQSCQIDLLWLRIYFRHIRRRGLPPPDGWSPDKFFRFVGQFSELGKGEVLLHEQFK